MDEFLPDDVVEVVGLMSGTSADGIDAAVVKTDGLDQFECLEFVSIPYSDAIREKLLRVAQDNESATQSIDDLEQELTDLHAEAVRKVVGTRHRPQLIGLHGHTVAHDPNNGITRQLGDGQRLANALQIPVVFDFRQADIDAGGQGAPLAPLFHAHRAPPSPRPCAVVNIGGVANITWLDGQGANQTIIAGDTGPGCALLDDWVRQRTENSPQPRHYDKDGLIAEQGSIDGDTLNGLTEISFFGLPFPKSADRFDFHAIDTKHLSTEDGAATLCAITANTIADGILSIGNPAITWVSGGGSHHPLIMRLLRERLGHVESIAACGLNAESIEAECFAWLAVRTARGRTSTRPTTTGCSTPTVCGRLVHPD